MTLQIPSNFNVRTQQIDANEQYIRDVLQLDILNWAKFRHTINIGNNANNLHSSAMISESTKEAYRELAKSHYEVVTSLGCVRLALDELNQPLHPLLFKKRTKDFYFHIGCIVDNMARLIFILNDPQSATARNRRGHLTRHWIDWGSLPEYPGYKKFKRSAQLREIINVRNNLVHSWAIPSRIDANGIVSWPIRVRTARSHPWPYDELQRLNSLYRSWRPVSTMVTQDFEFICKFQSDVFRRLIRDVKKFEQNFQLEIR